MFLLMTCFKTVTDVFGLIMMFNLIILSVLNFGYCWMPLCVPYDWCCITWHLASVFFFFPPLFLFPSPSPSFSLSPLVFVCVSLVALGSWIFYPHLTCIFTGQYGWCYRLHCKPLFCKSWLIVQWLIFILFLVNCDVCDRLIILVIICCSLFEWRIGRRHCYSIHLKVVLICTDMWT